VGTINISRRVGRVSFPRTPTPARRRACLTTTTG